MCLEYTTHASPPPAPPVNPPTNFHLLPLSPLLALPPPFFFYIHTIIAFKTSPLPPFSLTHLYLSAKNSSSSPPPFSFYQHHHVPRPRLKHLLLTHPLSAFYCFFFIIPFLYRHMAFLDFTSSSSLLDVPPFFISLLLPKSGIVSSFEDITAVISPITHSPSPSSAHGSPLPSLPPLPVTHSAPCVL